MNLANPLDDLVRYIEVFSNCTSDQRRTESLPEFWSNVLDFADHLFEHVSFGEQCDLFWSVDTRLSCGKEDIIHGRLKPGMPVLKVNGSRHCAFYGSAINDVT